MDESQYTEPGITRSYIILSRVIYRERERVPSEILRTGNRIHYRYGKNYNDIYVPGYKVKPYFLYPFIILLYITYKVHDILLYATIFLSCKK